MLQPCLHPCINLHEGRHTWVRFKPVIPSVLQPCLLVCNSVEAPAPAAPFRLHSYQHTFQLCHLAWTSANRNELAQDGAQTKWAWPIQSSAPPPSCEIIGLLPLPARLTTATDAGTASAAAACMILRLVHMNHASNPSFAGLHSLAAALTYRSDVAVAHQGCRTAGYYAAPCISHTCPFQHRLMYTWPCPCWFPATVGADEACLGPPAVLQHLRPT